MINFYPIHFFQAVVLTLTLTFVAIGTWGTVLIRQHFDPILLLPGESYLRQWINVHDKHFPKVQFSPKSNRFPKKETFSVFNLGWLGCRRLYGPT